MATKRYRFIGESDFDLINGETYNCKKGTNHSLAGYNCSALIMYDNWEIAKDYPW